MEDLMVYGKALNQYKRNTIESVGKLDLVIMCYEKTIQLLIQSKEHLMEKELEKKVYKVQKALDIISNLQSSLNMEKGGDIARNLDSLYSYMLKRLLVGDIQKDISAFDESIKILSELKEAWDTIKTDAAVQESSFPKNDLMESHSSRASAY
jgi:flagellar secretion chaperone FliS